MKTVLTDVFVLTQWFAIIQGKDKGKGQSVQAPEGTRIILNSLLDWEC
jgi:hypothetical protein